MNRNPHLERGFLLQSQGRHDMAEGEFRQYLALEPNHGSVHAALAISLAAQEKRDEAERAAKQAIALEPDNSFVFFTLGAVLADRRRDAEAAQAVREAIRLDPENADCHGLLARIELTRERWNAALEAAENGLQFDPEDADCNNARAVALVKLGRRAEAGATLDSTLARDPDNDQTHANKGWALLESGQRKEAMHHFKESLRLDPTNDWARAGLVEALKAGNPLYAVMLKYILWMSKLSDRARWGFILGGYFGNQILGSMARSNPDLAPWILPLRVVYIAFVLLTWLAVPLFNLMLFLHPIGRHALDSDQRNQARVTGGMLGAAALSLGAGFALGNSLFTLLALVLGLLTLPSLAIFNCANGWPRRTMVALVAVLAAVGLFPIVTVLVANPAAGTPASDSALASLWIFFVGVLLSQFAANWLMTQRPTR